MEVTYFYPAIFPAHQIFGLIVALVGVLANALSSILGRHVNRSGLLPPLSVTIVSMGVGAAILLSAGVLIQGLPKLSLLNWAIIGWLAVVNTAFAFTLWNLTLRLLSAMESSIINNAMMIQIPVLALLFLGERLSVQEAIGLVLAAAGILGSTTLNRGVRLGLTHRVLRLSRQAQAGPPAGEPIQNRLKKTI